MSPSLSHVAGDGTEVIATAHARVTDRPARQLLGLLRMSIQHRALLCSFLVGACGDNATVPESADAGGDHAARPTPMSCRYAGYVLTEYLHGFEATLSRVSGHLFGGEAIGFHYFPGSEDMLVWLHLGPLIAECSEPVVYDETCFELEGYCARVECPGGGADWKLHTRMTAPYDRHNWKFDAGEVHTHWTAGTQHLAFTLSSAAIGPAGDDWSTTGGGAIDADSFTLDVTIADPLRRGPTRLEAAGSLTSGYSGQLTIDGVVAAIVSGAPAEHGIELIPDPELCTW